MRWTKLRQIQVDAIHEIFDGDGDLIIAARTAAGKTEAAFLPILSRMLSEPAQGVRAVYVGPLKALINDQFSRLEELVPRGRDPRAQVARRRLGVTETPPARASVGRTADHARVDRIALRESRPSARRGLSVTRIHRHRRASLVHRHGTRRAPPQPDLPIGGQEPRAGSPRRPIGDAWAGPGRRPPLASAGRPRWRSDHRRSRAEADSVANLRLPSPSRAAKIANRRTTASNQRASIDGDLERDVFDAFNGKTALIFVNTKSDIEKIADYARQESERRGLPNSFRVHHGSLSKGEREETEEALKSAKPTATFCSSTLEMGIDVGNVKLVGQIGPPWSVSSLTQRLGRSGRKEGEASIIRIYIEEDEPEQDTSLFRRLFLDLLQATAMTKLMLEKWCEPPEVDRLHLSTLMQQVLSVIKERGGARAETLHRTLGARRRISQRRSADLASSAPFDGRRRLDRADTRGILITGLLGEKIVGAPRFLHRVHRSGRIPSQSRGPSCRQHCIRS